MKNLPGFTLIEMLVIVALIGVLSGVGLSAYNRFNEKQRVEQAATNFALLLRKVQKQVNSGELPTLCSGPLEKYQVRTGINSGIVVVRVTCGGVDHDYQEPDMNTVKFMTNTDFTFVPLGQGLAADATAKMVNVQESLQSDISANTGGIITVSQVTSYP